MAVKYSNNASTTLNGAINASVTTITVNDASEFPTLTGSDYTYLTLSNLAATSVEIIKVTAIDTVTKELTVERGQDDTTGAIFSSGDICELRLNAAMLNAAASQNDDALGTAVAMSIALG
jgi:hypothetical protein